MIRANPQEAHIVRTAATDIASMIKEFFDKATKSKIQRFHEKTIEKAEDFMRKHNLGGPIK